MDKINVYTMEVVIMKGHQTESTISQMRKTYICQLRTLTKFAHCKPSTF